MIELVYERRGQGVPLVLLHGIGHRWQAWEPVLDRLAEHHEVIAVDLPGFGASPALPEDVPYDIPHAVQALADVFGALGVGFPHVAGNSLGGTLALELASRGLVRSATALAPAGFWTPRDRAWALNVLRTVRRMGGAPESLRRLMVGSRAARVLSSSVMFGRPSLMDAKVLLADLTSMVGSTGFDLVAASGADYVFASPEPSVPTTVAWGSRDRILWPRQASKAAALLPSATHVSLPRCGHVPMNDDPELITRTILGTCVRAATAGPAAA
jgi:pimeloyl-ACP methyl ester carboxylesterase